MTANFWLAFSVSAILILFVLLVAVRLEKK